MSASEIIRQLLGLLAGMGVFLVAIKIVSASLESVGGNRLKSLFSKSAKNTIFGVGIGTAATALVQSSGATSVMAIGFVNSGVMSLQQACAIVLGANIGTTVTGQIAAIGFLGGGTTLSASVVLAALSGVGALVMYFARGDRARNIGGLVAGLGLLFVGLSMMSGSMEVFARDDAIEHFIASIDFPGHSIVLVLVGVVLTALIQSSSVTSSVAIAMLVSGLISLNQGIYLVLGSNIGACVVALFACIGASRRAKCVASFHIVTNIARVAAYLVIIWVLAAATGGSFSPGGIFERMFPDAAPLRLSMFHTFFNVVSVACLLPFFGLFVKMSPRFVSGVPAAATGNAQDDETEDDGERKDSSNRLYYIDDHLLKTPPVAVQQVKNEIVNMADIAIRNFNTSLEIICELDFSALEQFRANERELNFLNAEITKFAVKLSKLPMGEEDHLYLATTFHTVSDLERIGDYAENIIEYADKLRTSHERFSPDAIAEIAFVRSRINDLFAKVMDVYMNLDMDTMSKVEEIEDEIDDITDNMSENHIRRLDKGVCTPDVGAQYLSLASNAERVADHLVNVAHSLAHARR